MENIHVHRLAIFNGTLGHFNIFTQAARVDRSFCVCLSVGSLDFTGLLGLEIKIFFSALHVSVRILKHTFG